MNKQIEIFYSADLDKLQYIVNEFLKQDGIRELEEIDIQFSTVKKDIVSYVIVVSYSE